MPNTPNLDLEEPAAGSATWGTPNNSNFSKIDAGVVVNTPITDQTITGAHALVLSDPGSTFWEKGAVGVGLGVPGGFGPLGFWDTSAIDVERNVDSSVNIPVALGVGLNWNAAADKHGGQIAGIWNEVSTDPSSSNNIDTVLIGILSEADHNGSGNVSSMEAMDLTVLNFGTGTITNNVGVNIFTGNRGTGLVTNDTGIFIDSPDGTGPITNIFGLDIDNRGGRATTLGAAIHVSNQGTAATDYSFYSEGGRFRIDNTPVPATAASAGTKGQIAWDTGFIYVCINTNTWKRVAIATW